MFPQVRGVLVARGGNPQHLLFVCLRSGESLPSGPLVCLGAFCPYFFDRRIGFENAHVKGSRGAVSVGEGGGALRTLPEPERSKPVSNSADFNPLVMVAQHAVILCGRAICQCQEGY